MKGSMKPESQAAHMLVSMSLWTALIWYCYDQPSADSMEQIAEGHVMII